MNARRLLLLATALVCACTEAPTAADLGDLEDADRWYLEHHAMPGGADSPERTVGHVWLDAEEADLPAAARGLSAGETSSPPRIVVGRLRADDEYDTTFCPFTVKTIGFPAVRSDGTQVVAATRNVPSSSDGEDEYMTIDWMSPDAGGENAMTMLFDGGVVAMSGDASERDACRTLRRETIERAKKVNAQLREHAWRPLNEMDVAIQTYYGGDGRDGDFMTDYPAKSRPVELVWQHGELIFRIPKVKVLARSAAGWEGDGADNCDVNAHIDRAWSDEAAGVALISYDHNSGACFCNSATETAVVRVPEVVFEQIARRSTSPDDEDE